MRLQPWLRGLHHIMTRRVREALAGGPLSVGELMAQLGVTRLRLHTLIHKSGPRIVRVDLGPTCGPTARPVYALRSALTVRS